jgi:DNA-binding transcriptional ArsR family regulator
MAVDSKLTNRIDLLEGIDNRERVILIAIFQFQLGNQRGLSWGELLNLKPIQKEMSRQTFSHRLKDLLRKELLEREVIKNKRGKPTLYRLEAKLFSELREFRDRFTPWGLDKEIQRFEKDVGFYETQRYVEAMMELAFGLLNTLAIALTNFETEGARWLFYEATYENVEQLFRYILNRASKSMEDRRQTLTMLFELLKSFSDRSVGKRFELDKVYNSREEITEAILKRELSR